MDLQKLLQKKIAEIRPLDSAAMEAAERRQAALAKPPGSLGVLEKIAVQAAGITKTAVPVFGKTRIYVFAADNGVCAEGVSCAPQSVTLSQAIHLTQGCTGASSIAKCFGDELVVVDVGIAAEYDCPEIVNRSIAKGTKNLAKEPAMTREQALSGILCGMELAQNAKKDGVCGKGQSHERNQENRGGDI